MRAAAAVKLAKQVPTAVYVVGGIAALLIGWQLYKAIRGALEGIGRAAGAVGDSIDRGVQGAADAYVDATTEDVELAGGVVLVLPNGARVAQSLTTPAGGGKFRYLGVLYEIIEALGNGAYRAQRVG